MTEAQLVEAITAQFLSQWATLHATGCPVALEGETFDTEDTWVRLSIVPVDGEQLSIGAVGQRLVSDSGFVAVQVFTPVNAGIAARAALADDVRTALQFKTLTVVGVTEGVRLYKGVSRDPQTDGRWMMQNVVLAYSVVSTA